MAGVEVPVGHAVVEEDAGVAGYEGGAPAALDALQLADGVAVPVGYYEAGGILRFG